MGKLVRDLIPQLFSGQTRTLTDSEYRTALRAKLGEEVAEYLESGDVMELADVLEVVYALAALDGVSATEMETLRLGKANERGGFKARIWWEAK